MYPSKPQKAHGLLVATAIGVCVSAIAAWLLWQVVDPPMMWELAISAQPAFVGMAVLSLCLSMLLRTARWRSILPPMREEAPGTARLLPFVILGYAANSIMPLRLGDAARAVLSARRFAAGIPEMLGSVGLERLLDALALALLLLLASIGAVVPLWFGQAIVTILAASLSILVCVQLLSRGPALARHTRLRLITRVWHGARVEPYRVTRSLGWSVLAWCADGVTFWLCGLALGLDLSLGTALLVAGGAALGGILPSAPASIGTFELGGTAVAVTLGLTATDALTLVLLSHAVTVIPIIVAGALVAGAMGLNLRDLRRVSALGERGTPTMPAAEGAS